LSVAVPGELLGYAEAKLRFGNPEISWLDLLRPTIAMCETGIPVTRSIARDIRAKEVIIRADPGMK
jgi:gamma-glutamyltranspeptidase